MLRFPPRRILVAVEFSKESFFAWEAAREISDRYGAALEAVWCVPSVATEATGLANLSRRPGYRAEGLRRLRARLGPDARLHAVNGDPAFAIRRIARERRCDLVVMGTRPRPLISRWVQGSVAESVVRGASCPVLIVTRAWRAPRRILAPVHGAGYAKRGLLAAAVLARAYEGRLTLLEVVSKPSLAVLSAKRLSLRAEKLPPSMFRSAPPEYEVRVGEPVREILRAERARDMVVLVAHRKSFLGDMLKGTTVERVMRHSRLPVLAIPSR